MAGSKVSSKNCFCFSGLKALYIPAQGNALGSGIFQPSGNALGIKRNNPVGALKG
ncbi:MAG: hypothetical protein LBS88_10050 [Tannerellaceae bacterium]|jgi:hypothetical protein|nr:hypothetical protein [Tannerellaceae bacterium]